MAHLANPTSFNQTLAQVAKMDWFVYPLPDNHYAKQPFAGPHAVLAYLSRYTHRVAISNHRLLAHDNRGVTFQWKDYRTKHRVRYKSMTLATDEFIRRFLTHVLPRGFHRIRHYGLFANPVRRDNLTRLRQALNVHCEPELETETHVTSSPTFVCRTCGAPLQIVEILRPKMRSPP